MCIFYLKSIYKNVYDYNILFIISNYNFFYICLVKNSGISIRNIKNINKIIVKIDLLKYNNVFLLIVLFKNNLIGFSILLFT